MNNWPRVSSGPDLTQLVLGSEGNLGLITEAIVRIRPLPETKEYQSIVFPNFEYGVKFIEHVGKSRIWPASIRVVDNT